MKVEKILLASLPKEEDLQPPSGIFLDVEWPVEIMEVLQLDVNRCGNLVRILPPENSSEDLARRDLILQFVKDIVRTPLESRLLREVLCRCPPFPSILRHGANEYSQQGFHFTLLDRPQLPVQFIDPETGEETGTPAFDFFQNMGLVLSPSSDEESAKYKKVPRSSVLMTKIPYPNLSYSKQERKF